MLYQMADDIEEVLNNSELGYKNEDRYVDQLVNITDQLSKEPEIRIISLPAMQMILSPYGDPQVETGELQEWYNWAKLELFEGQEEFPYGGSNPLFAYQGEQGFRFLVRKPHGYQEKHNWQEHYLPGGLYAVFAAWLPEIMKKHRQLLRWLKKQ